MIAQQQQKRLAGHEVAGTPDGMAITLRLRLDREPQTLLKVRETAGLLLGPLHAFEG